MLDMLFRCRLDHYLLMSELNIDHHENRMDARENTCVFLCDAVFVLRNINLISWLLLECMDVETLYTR